MTKSTKSTKPTKEFEEQSNFGKKLTRAQIRLIRGKSTDTQKLRRLMLDGGDDEIETHDLSFESIFDDPEKL